MRATITTSMVAAVLLAISLTVASYAVDNPHITPQVSPSAMLTPDESVEPIPEPEETETPTIETTAQYEYWEDIPLDDEVQEHVFSLCEEKGIDPEIVFAMIWRESRYQADVIGDNGKSFGLMQVQERLHKDRMERLGVTDLLDPIQNVTVGIDYLSELYSKYGDIAQALVAYNSGSYRGTVTNYAKSVLEKANEIGGDSNGN